MKKLLALPLCSTAFGQGVEVKQTTTEVTERSYLQSVRVIYGVVDSTNVVATQIQYTIAYEEQRGSGPWIKLEPIRLGFSRLDASNWVLSYTNKSGVLVTNNIRNSVLSDFDRVDLFPARSLNILKTPQATVAQPVAPEPLVPE